LDWIRERWANATRRARLLFLAIVALALVLILILTLWLNHKDWVVLYEDLTMPESAQVIAVLNENAIPYDTDIAGRLLVEDSNENNARLQLAILGFENAGFDYTIMNSGGLTATQQDKDRNYINNLQNRLQATIELIPEIQRAIVTITMPQRSVLALSGAEEVVSASVTITRKPGRSLTTDQVRGIVNIVKDSVQNLDEANLSIVDVENGDLKSSLDLDSDFNNRKLDLTQQVNTSIESQILRVVQPAYGPEDVKVVVSTRLNTDSSVAERTTYLPLDPENPTNNPLDYAEYDRQRTGDGFPAAGGIPGTNDNVETPQYAILEDDAANSDYYSGHDIWDYLVGNLREQIVKDGFIIERASASILINTESLPDADVNAIIALASNASGIEGAAITVQGMLFDRPVLPDEPPITGRGLTFWFLIIGLPLLLVCIILIIVLTAMARRRREQEAALLELEEGEQQSLAELMGQEPEFEPIALVESSEQKLKLQIKDLAESDPEIVAQLIKVWLNA
jgi:flagellar M-ring protein FliF